MKISKAQQYARLREEQFSIFEKYARMNGMNNKSLLVFMWIYHNPAALTQETIAKRTYSTKQVIQAIIKTYIAKEILCLEPSQNDKRKKFVKLTEKGQTFASQILEPLATYETEAMAALTEKQQKILLEATQVFSHKLNTLLEVHHVPDTGKDPASFI
ncbi:MarR family winged helix-turn-helix transcriptional regulator [Lactovum miscens]|nr:MarR family transcriptional regulator [Lactovum miscens]